MHLLVVGLARPALYERRPDWAPEAVSIELQALGPDVCRELVREVLQHAGDVPRSPGRPDRRAAPTAIRSTSRSWSRCSSTTAVIERRRTGRAMADRRRSIGPITSAGDADRRAPGSPRQPASDRAQRVAAGRRGGRIFWDGAVSALGDGDRVRLLPRSRGRRRELVHRRSPSAFAECAEFIFKHALLRDVTYETVLHRDRPTPRTCSDLAGGDRRRASHRYREVIAYHLELAGDPAGAAGQLLRAGVVVRPSAIRPPFGHWQGAGVVGRREHPGRPHGLRGLSEALRIIGRVDEADDLALRGLASPRCLRPSGPASTT